MRGMFLSVNRICRFAARGRLAVIALLAAQPAFAVLDVVETNGTFAVIRDGKTVVRGVTVALGGDGRHPGEQRSFVRQADGAKVWNVWSEDPDCRYRLEVVRRSDGAVEMTLAGQISASSPYTTRRLYLFVPSDVFDGREYEALQGDGRAWRPKKGVFDSAFRRNSFRWLASEGLLWDFNPVGAGSYCNMYRAGTIQGVWTFIKRSGGRSYELSSGSVVRSKSGNLTGTKIVLREDSCGDYFKYHHLGTFHYSQRCRAAHAVVLGAPRFGKSYENGDLMFDAKRGFGWRKGLRRSVKVGHPSGAYYSHVCGDETAIYRFAGLTDGFYVFTIQMGNWTGDENHFSVQVNGTVLGENLSVEKGMARTISQVVRISGGIADVRFEGRWIASAIAVQPLMADAEDFSVRRGMWFSSGYEPCILYRTCDFARPMEFGRLDETIVMPEPGKEGLAKPRDPPMVREGVSASDDPAFAWLRSAKTYSFAGNASPLDFAKEGKGSVEEIFRTDTDGMGYNVAFVSGLHSRHTYIGHESRGIESIRSVAEVAHRRGMKVIDHHDATLLWNEMGGFRAMMSRLPETIRSVHDNLPSFQLCPNNPVFKKTYRAYLRKLVEAGVDGFQLDEIVFWAHGCACKACREKFHAETAWQLPLDETDATFSDWRSRIARRWHAWKVRCIANWFAELKASVNDIKPDLAILMYSTHWGMVASQPRNGLVNDLMGLGRVVNYFGTEVMTRNPIQSSRSLMPYRRMMNMFTLAYGSPVWGIFYGDADEGSYLAWSISNMLGQSALLHGRGKGRKDFVKWGASEWNMVRTGAQPVADVALLFSSCSRDWNKDISFIEEEFGLAQELEALHVPYEFIGDMNLSAARLKKYKMLCLGASCCLSDADIAAIKDYMADGGIVYTAVEAGRCNEFGEARASWPFEEVKGNFIYRPDMRAAAFCAREAEVGAIWEFNPDLQAERDYRMKLSGVLSGVVSWRVSAPDTVFTSIWREADGTAAIHFVNAGGACLKPGDKITSLIPQTPFPPIMTDIMISFIGGKVKSAVATSPDFDGERPLDVLGDGGTRVVLPKHLFKTYTLVRLKLATTGLEGVAYMDRFAKNGTTKALLAAREDVIKSHDQKTVDAWRLAAGRAIDGNMK